MHYILNNCTTSIDDESWNLSIEMSILIIFIAINQNSEFINIDVMSTVLCFSMLSVLYYSFYNIINLKLAVLVVRFRVYLIRENCTYSNAVMFVNANYTRARTCILLYIYMYAKVLHIESRFNEYLQNLQLLFIFRNFMSGFISSIYIHEILYEFNPALNLRTI